MRKRLFLTKGRILITSILVNTLAFAVLPAMPAYAVEVCRVSTDGTAVYPPNLPDCLDPVVLAKQEADAKAAADASAAASASAKAAAELAEQQRIADRKSTRLNSSHT